MPQLLQMPDHTRFEQLLSSIDLDVGASEMHGVICGLLCAGHADAHAAWFEDLFRNRSQDDLLVRETRQLLGQLYQTTQAQLGSEFLDFAPFLPDDESPISARARSLSKWSQGFLYGLGLAAITEAQLAVDAKEAISDISEFTRIDYAGIESGEEAEQDFMQLEQFLRVATLLIRDELSTDREAPNGAK